ncbi:hypothetical protein IO424_001759 [Campylobacter fetus]|uniref:hypothetical protein n=1 Tax=Campylobacter fetus TaxID=196 RepID=UPI0005091E67|nr:hypothetical protein [Campylobacter fetus]WKW17961.1 hypothetical protein IXZ25_03535 [Campylobacter fetus subsp. fetus]AIR78589.1 hypothetical protein CFF04554_0672 [Campylobacter fetus subsp. fetus 04/554]EAJ5693198.1 hypothetical protein [Campylobacter fetus]EAJ5705192.1 hypothetical protein [Campylobacter fetus]EAJ9257410.1 hypothetical protein [Campylobacter fetus]
MIYDKNNIKIVNQCLDTLVIGVRCYDGQLYSSTYQNFINELKSLKSSAKQIKSYGEKFVKSDLGLGFGDFLISSRSQGDYIANMRNNEISVFWSNSRILSNRYHLKIEFRSKFLLQYGHKRCLEYVKSFLKKIFLNYYEIQVIRFDLATDIAGLSFTNSDFLRFQTLRKISSYSDIKDFLIDDVDKELNNELKSTSNINFSRYINVDGFSFGKSPFMFRIYDKIKQISQKQISTLVFLKWKMNGFNPSTHKSVFRFESEIHRPIFRKFVKDMFFPNDDYIDEVDFLFKNLGFFWRYSLGYVKWHDLSDEEISKMEINSYTQQYINKLYKKCESDFKRFDLWSFMNKFNCENVNNLQRQELISKIDILKAKNALKSFVSAVYTNLGTDLDSFIAVFEETERDLNSCGINLHEYGLIKVCGKFLDFNKQDKQDNPYTPVIRDNVLDIYNLFSRICNSKDKYTLKYTLDSIGYKND